VTHWWADAQMLVACKSVLQISDAMHVVLFGMLVAALGITKGCVGLGLVSPAVQ
jgi:hypothetical protein